MNQVAIDGSLRVQLAGAAKAGSPRERRMTCALTGAEKGRPLCPYAQDIGKAELDVWRMGTGIWPTM